MRYVSITPRVDAWLRSIPIALIGAILGPVAVNGGPPEWLGLIAAVGLMYFTANDFVSTLGACAGPWRCRARGARLGHSSSSTTRRGSTVMKASLPSASGSIAAPRMTRR